MPCSPSWIYSTAKILQSKRYLSSSGVVKVGILFFVVYFFGFFRLGPNLPSLTWLCSKRLAVSSWRAGCCLPPPLCRHEFFCLRLSVLHLLLKLAAGIRSEISCRVLELLISTMIISYCVVSVALILLPGCLQRFWQVFVPLSWRKRTLLLLGLHWRSSHSSPTHTATTRLDSELMAAKVLSLPYSLFLCLSLNHQMLTEWKLCGGHRIHCFNNLKSICQLLVFVPLFNLKLESRFDYFALISFISWYASLAYWLACLLACWVAAVLEVLRSPLVESSGEVVILGLNAIDALATDSGNIRHLCQLGVSGGGCSCRPA